MRPPQGEAAQVSSRDRCRAGLVWALVGSPGSPKGTGVDGEPSLCKAWGESPGGLQSFERPPPTYSAKSSRAPTVGQA